MLEPIILLQKKIVRIICGLGYRDSTADYFRELNILPLDKLIEYNVCKLMFDYRNRKLPSSFTGTWKLNSEMHERTLRNNDDFFIRTLPTEFLKNLPLYKFPAVWNNLPAELKIINNRTQFLNELRTILLNSIRF